MKLPCCRPLLATVVVSREDVVNWPKILIFTNDGNEKNHTLLWWNSPILIIKLCQPISGLTVKSYNNITSLQRNINIQIYVEIVDYLDYFAMIVGLIQIDYFVEMVFVPEIVNLFNKRQLSSI